jgi:hypothetical protein
MQLRHISPRSSEWVDAMDEGGRGWEKLAPEELERLRVSAQVTGWSASERDGGSEDDYGWGEAAASR